MPSRSRHTPTLRSTRVHLVVIVPIFSLISPSSRHLIVVVTLVRPSRTHRRLHPIRYHVSFISLYLLPVQMHSSAQVPLLHRRAPTEPPFDIWGLPNVHSCARRRRRSWMDERCRPWSEGVAHLWLGGDGWDVHISVACILACFIIAASTPVLLVLYVRYDRNRS